MTPEIDGPPQGERLNTEPVHGVGAHGLNPDATPEEEERAFSEARRKAREDLVEKVGDARWWKDPESPEDRLDPFRVGRGICAVVVVIRGVREVEDGEEEEGEGGEAIIGG